MQALALLLCMVVLAARAFDLDMLLSTDNILSTINLEETLEPSAEPTTFPTLVPTAAPTSTPAPTSKPTRMPTAKPTTRAPTPSPTIPGLNLISFKVNQPIYGLSSTYYYANQALIDYSFKQAVAFTMSGVSPDDIQDLVFTFVQGLVKQDMRRLSITPTANAKFKVVAHVPGATYQSLSSQYITASSGAGSLINTYIALFAVENGVSGFTVSEPFVENSLTSRPASKMLTGAQITGLIIGIFMFIVLAAIIVWFALEQRKPLPESEFQAHHTVETQL